jgi:O-acetyl-ADP-ribose deacetylase (regulator of RNase III)
MAVNPGRSVALPALSTGAYRYPLDEAARVAINMAVDFLEQQSADSVLTFVRFVLFLSETFTAFERMLGSITERT